ncbi:hypothetical protein, partial [Mycobacteroides abscessus]|uniref:hypothetical protein n=1 Tax=Mycobacteroides abscessus TaxID=36809 RepID=UPI001A98B3D9
LILEISKYRNIEIRDTRAAYPRRGTNSADPGHEACIHALECLANEHAASCGGQVLGRRLALQS